MEIHQDTMETESRQLRLDRGYDALRAGAWQEAEAIFSRLLEEDPGCGLSCLGKALTAKKIHGREELQDHFQELRQDPEFQSFLKPAAPDFIKWLQKEMGEGASPEPSAHAERILSLETMEKKPLRLFIWIQAALYLIASLLFSRTGSEAEDWYIPLLGSLMFSAMACGLPMILGSLYGRSILRNGRFRVILKILNNIVGVLGCGVMGILVAAFHASLEGDPITARGDRFYCYAFAVCFLVHLISLLFPAFLNSQSDT